MGKQVRIEVCDDNPHMRAALRNLLESEPDLTVAGETTTADDAVEALRTGRPDVLLLDVSLPGRSGLDALPDLRAASPGTAVVVISMEGGPAYEQRALSFGADAFVLKDDAEELILAVRKAAHLG